MAALSRVVGQSIGLLCLAVTTCLQAQSFGYPEIVAPQNDDRLEEISGLAPAHSQPDYFWAINDGGNGSALLLLDDQGQYKDVIWPDFWPWLAPVVAANHR